MRNTLSPQAIRRTLAKLSMTILLTGCVQAPAFKGDNYALLDSNYPIIAINGTATENTYQADIKAGEITVEVVYNTYRFDYHCTFRWNAAAGTAYEITDQENRYPLTLYRWHRRNGLWALRLDPIDPLRCDRRPGDSFLSPD